MKSKVLIITTLLSVCTISLAQTADTLIVRQLEEEGVQFSRNNAVTLLQSGQEKFDDMFTAIRQARSSVHLEYFNFRNDSIAHLLFDLLAEKVKEGVEVRALFDGFGNDSNNKPLKKRHLREIRSKGIEIYEFDPVNFPWINHVFSRDHRKIVVIDGKIAYTGGMNVADYYIKGTEMVGEWRDMHCRIDGDEVNTLQKIFLRKFYLEAINVAQDSIKIINPYLTLNRKLKRALRKAVERGVKVEVMVSAHSDIPLTPDCVFYNVHRLMKHGVEVWIYKPGFHHTKIITVDGRFCTVGSANLNARSLRFDYEDNAVIIDPCTTQELDRMFNEDKLNSFRLTEESWDMFRTPWKKFVGWFAHLLSPFL